MIILNNNGIYNGVDEQTWEALQSDDLIILDDI
jgi:hypothetical protein